MGHKYDEGNAVDVVHPGTGGLTIVKGELYRIEKWNGFALSTVKDTDDELGLSIDTSHATYMVTLPSGLAAAKGALLYWSASDGFKEGPKDLVVSGGGAIGPVCKVVVAVDANRIAGVKVLNNAI